MLPNANKKLLGVIIFLPLLILLGVYQYLLWPLQKDVNHLETEIKSEKIKLETLKASRIENNDGTEVNKKTSEILPTDSAIDELVLLFRNAENVSTSTIESINAVESSTSENNAAEGKLDGVQFISYQLIVSAKNYASLTKFIDTIEHADRIVILSTSNLSSDTGFTLTSGNIRADITIVAYYNPIK